MSAALLGALLAGLFGTALPGPPWLGAALATLLLVWFAAALARLAPEPRVTIPGLRSAGRLLSATHPLGRFGFGMNNGVIPGPGASSRSSGRSPVG
jgi:hypothetical protein